MSSTIQARRSESHPQGRDGTTLRSGIFPMLREMLFWKNMRTRPLDKFKVLRIDRLRLLLCLAETITMVNFCLGVNTYTVRNDDKLVNFFQCLLVLIDRRVIPILCRHHKEPITTKGSKTESLYVQIPGLWNQNGVNRFTLDLVFPSRLLKRLYWESSYSHSDSWQDNSKEKPSTSHL